MIGFSIPRSGLTSHYCCVVMIGILCVFLTAQASVVSAGTIDESTLEDVKTKIIDSRLSVKRFFVKFKAVRTSSNPIEKSPILKNLGKDEIQTFAFCGPKRYSDRYTTFFNSGIQANRYLAIYDGQTFFRRQNKFVTKSSLKSSTADLNCYLNLLLWPITDEDVERVKGAPEEARFLPRMLDGDWTISKDSKVISGRKCIELVEKGGFRKLWIAPDCNYSIAGYLFDESKTGPGFGESKCLFTNFRQVRECYFPFTIESTVEVYLPKTKEVSTVITNKVDVEELRINDDVSLELFTFTPSPGETVVDHDAGTVSISAVNKDENQLSNSIIEARSAFLTQNSAKPFQLVNMGIYFIALIIGIFLAATLRWLFPAKLGLTKTLVACFVVLNLSDASISQGQVPTSHKLRFEALKPRKYQQNFKTQIDGNLAALWTPSTEFSTPLPLMEILCRDFIANELEIVDYQKNDLKNATRKLSDSLARSQEILDDAVKTIGYVDDEAKARIVDVLSGPVIDSNRLVSELLLPNQIEILEEIFLVFKIRRTGLYAAITQGALKDKLNLSRAQIARLELTYRKALPDKLRAIADMKEKALKELLGILTQKQRQRILDEVGNLEVLASIPICVFLHQFEVSRTGSDAKLEDTNPWPEYASVLYESEFSISFDGKLVFRKADFSKIEPRITIPDQIIEILNAASCQEYLGLTNDQKNEVENLRTLRRQFYSDENLAMNQHIQENGMNKFRGFRDKMLEKRIRLGVLAIDSSNSILNAEQQQLLRRIVTTSGCHRIGLAKSLSELELGRSIGITERQRVEIGKYVDRTFPALRKQAQETEAALNRKLVDVLDSSQRRLLRSITDRTLELETGHVELQSTLLRPAVARNLSIEAKHIDEFIGLVEPKK